MAFNNCKELKEVIWGKNSSLETIGAYSFQNTGITNMNIPDEVTEIGQEAFSSSADLESIVFPKGVTVIPKHCCSYCKNLSQVTILGEVETIGAQAFRACNLYDFPFPDSLKEVGLGSFSHNSIENLDLSNTQLMDIPKNAFEKNHIETLKLPDYLIAISEKAFADNSIPESLIQYILGTVVCVDDTAFIMQHKI
jgi:hypothetical protein